MQDGVEFVSAARIKNLNGFPDGAVLRVRVFGKKGGMKEQELYFLGADNNYIGLYERLTGANDFFIPLRYVQIACVPYRGNS